jgi:hypothetical protein
MVLAVVALYLVKNVVKKIVKVVTKDTRALVLCLMIHTPKNHMFYLLKHFHVQMVLKKSVYFVMSLVLRGLKQMDQFVGKNVKAL